MDNEYNRQLSDASMKEQDYSYPSNNNAGNNRNHQHLDGSIDSETALQRMRTAGSISISPELFEKLYLSPQNAVKGELRKTFGNPTPLALVGFLLSLTPLSCDLMNWRGAFASGSGSAGIGAYFFFGGLLMILGGLGEWIVGNTFPFIVFSSFGAFWLTFAAVLAPSYGSISNYATATTPGTAAPAFNAAFGFFLLWMGVLCFIYMILALRTNMVFVGIFLTLIFAFGFLTAAYWSIADGHAERAPRFLVAAGAFCFITCMLGWWIFFAIMLAALDFPFQLPVGDLSTFIRGASQRAKDKEAQD